MALTKHGFKTKFGLNLGEETVEKKRRRGKERRRRRGREEEERRRREVKIKGMELLNLSMDPWFV